MGRKLAGRVIALASIAMVAVAACGGGGGGSASCASSSDLDPTSLIGDLTTAEEAQFCDWSVCLFGGYGAHVTCSSGSAVTIDSSQAQCVSTFSSSCMATVADFTSCFQAFAADPCSSTGFSSACSAWLQCAESM